MEFTITIDTAEIGTTNNLDESIDGAIRDAQEDAAREIVHIAELFYGGYLSGEETCAEIERRIEVMRKLGTVLHRKRTL